MVVFNFRRKNENWSGPKHATLFPLIKISQTNDTGAFFSISNPHIFRYPMLHDIQVSYTLNCRPVIRVTAQVSFTMWCLWGNHVKCPTLDETPLFYSFCVAHFSWKLVGGRLFYSFCVVQFSWKLVAGLLYWSNVRHLNPTITRPTFTVPLMHCIHQTLLNRRLQTGPTITRPTFSVPLMPCIHQSLQCSCCSQFPTQPRMIRPDHSGPYSPSICHQSSF